MSHSAEDSGGSVPARHSKTKVVAHWLLAILIPFMLAGGIFGLEPTANDDAGKIGILRGHMIGGIVVLAVLVLYWLSAARSPRIPKPPSGSIVLDGLARLVHLALPLTALVMVFSGLATAGLADLPPIIFGDRAGPVPDMLRSLGSFKVHSWAGKVMLGLLALHILGALYHQLILRDRPFGRMSLRSRDN